MNVAIIDLGTNTFNLLICEVSQKTFTIQFSGKTSPKLGKDGIHLGIISPDAFERGIHAIETLQKTIQKYHCNKIIAIGTSALRNAINGKEFCNKIKELFAIDIQIISGIQEAEYIFYGNKLAYNWGEKPALILDIGGGSNECIICTNSKILWKHSFENGMQRIISKYNPEYPFTEKNKIEIHSFLIETFSLLIQKSKEFSIDLLIGSSGPFDTFRNILEAKNPVSKNNLPFYSISLENFKNLHTSLINSTQNEIANMLGMDDARIEMLPIASTITTYMIDSLNLSNFIQSDYSLKEGVIYSIVNS